MYGMDVCASVICGCTKFTTRFVAVVLIVVVLLTFCTYSISMLATFEPCPIKMQNKYNEIDHDL